MAASRHKLAAIALFAACTAAAAQEREQLPIQLEARSQDLDFQKGVLKFDTVTITQGQVRITAERAVANGLDFKDSAWEFSGSVRISMPESTLASDTAEVKFTGGEVASAVVTGTPATFTQQREGQQSEGRANRIDYDLQRGTVEFSGDAWLKDGRNEVTSETLVYSTATQRVISKEPVVITIQPGEAAPEKPKPDS
ncbi:MAG: LptA/OstA family protein [Steroidobacteraceae bacterium]